jgi:hypothetical protein
MGGFYPFPSLPALPAWLHAQSDHEVAAVACVGFFDSGMCRLEATADLFSDVNTLSARRSI